MHGGKSVTSCSPWPFFLSFFVSKSCTKVWNESNPKWLCEFKQQIPVSVGWVVGSAASFVCFSVYCKSKWMEVLLLMMMALCTCNQIRAIGNLVDDESCLFFLIATKEEQVGNLSC
jgi:hypothetical protein